MGIFRKEKKSSYEASNVARNFFQEPKQQSTVSYCIHEVTFLGRPQGNFNINPSVTMGFKFQLLPRMEGVSMYNTLHAFTDARYTKAGGR